MGDPDTSTGGYLYHRRMADAAPQHDARLSFVSFPDRPFPLPLLWGRGVTARMRQQGSDVVVVDSIAAAFLAPWLNRLTTGSPVVAMLHQPPGGIDHSRLRSWLQARLDAHIYRRATKLLLASETLVEDVRIPRFAPREVVVVPPGRDVAENPSIERLDLRRGRRIALLCVGNWVPRKGIIDLLQALVRTPPETATLHLVGDQEVDRRYARRVRKAIEDLGIADRVIAHGWVARGRVASFYAGADAFVLASAREPYGTAYGEAMAAGLPVVGWDAGNLPLLATDGIEGFVVSRGDIEGLAAAIVRLATDEALRQSLGRAAFERARSLPTWEQTAERFFAELRAVVGRAQSLEIS